MSQAMETLEAKRFISTGLHDITTIFLHRIFDFHYWFEEDWSSYITPV